MTPVSHYLGSRLDELHREGRKARVEAFCLSERRENSMGHRESMTRWLHAERTSTSVAERERERESERESERDRQTKRDKERKRERQTDRERQRETDRQRER